MDAMMHLFDLMVSVWDMVRSGKRKAEEVAKWLQVVKDDPEFVKRLIGEVVVGVANTFSVDYLLSRAAALAPGKFKSIRYEVENSWFPIGDGVGEKKLIGDLVGGLGYCANTAEAQRKLAEKLKERGLGEKPMTIREFSVFAGAHPELCKDKLIGILGSVGEDADRDQYVASFTGSNGLWALNLRLVEHGWADHWCFAVSRE